MLKLSSNFLFTFTWPCHSNPLGLSFPVPQMGVLGDDCLSFRAIMGLKYNTERFFLYSITQMWDYHCRPSCVTELKDSVTSIKIFPYWVSFS